MIITEAQRLLRPGRRYAIHELALTLDSSPASVKTEIQQALARAIKVNARPLTVAEWRVLLGEHGLIVERVDTAPMPVLQLRRLIADEGIRAAAHFTLNVLTQPSAGRRVLVMRGTFRRYRHQLVAVAIIAGKLAPPGPYRPVAVDEPGSANPGEASDPGPRRG